MPTLPISGRIPLVQRLTFGCAVAAAVPYAVLKLLWLTGSTLGMTPDASAGEMSGTRYFVGNIATVGMVVVAIGLLFSLTRPWANRIPGAVVLVLGAGATGLLAPILVGMPSGLLIQTAVGGTPGPADQGLVPWVFALVYAGFCVLAAAVAVIGGTYVVQRWGSLLTDPPPAPSGLVVICGGVGMLPFALAMAYWAVSGPGDSGPQGMEQPAQRTVLFVTAALTLIAFITPLGPRCIQRWPRTAWLMTWTGCCVAALQGPTQILLAQGGSIEPLVVVIAVAATPGASLYGLAVLRRRLRGQMRRGTEVVGAALQPPAVGGAGG